MWHITLPVDKPSRNAMLIFEARVLESVRCLFCSLSAISCKTMVWSHVTHVALLMMVHWHVAVCPLQGVLVRWQHIMHVKHSSVGWSTAQYGTACTQWRRAYRTDGAALET